MIKIWKINWKKSSTLTEIALPNWHFILKSKSDPWFNMNIFLEELEKKFKLKKENFQIKIWWELWIYQWIFSFSIGEILLNWKFIKMVRKLTDEHTWETYEWLCYFNNKDEKITNDFLYYE